MMKSSKKRQTTLENKSISNFHISNTHLSKGLLNILQNKIQKGINFLVKCPHFNEFHTLHPLLKDVIKINLFSYLETFASRIYEEDSKLKIANVEFNIIYEIYAKLVRDKREQAKALYIKCKYNQNSLHYEIALAVSTEIIALDPMPKYYNARIKAYHALGQFNLALSDAQSALELSRSMEPNNESEYQRLVEYLKKSIEKSIQNPFTIKDALTLLAQNKVDEGTSLLQNILPLTPKDKALAKNCLNETSYKEAMANILDNLVTQGILFEKNYSTEIQNTIICKANTLLSLSDDPLVCARAHYYLGKVYFAQFHWGKSLDHFKKFLDIHPTDELIKTIITDIEEKLIEEQLIPLHYAESENLNHSTPDNPKKKKKKKKNKKKTDESPKTPPKINQKIMHLKEKFLENSTLMNPIIDENNKNAFEDKLKIINAIFAEAKLIKCDNDAEKKQLNELVSHFNKLFSEIFLKLQHLEKKDENSAHAFYQSLTLLTPLNENMKIQIYSALKKLEKKTTQNKEAKDLEKNDNSSQILEKISHLPKTIDFDIAVEELRAELTPDQYHESNPDNIERIYQQYKIMDFTTLSMELKEILEITQGKHLKKILSTQQKELNHRAKQQKEIETLYEKIKDKGVKQHQAHLQEKIDRLQSLCTINQSLIQETADLKVLSLSNPEGAKLKLIVIQNDIKKNAIEISKMNNEISIHLTKPLASQKEAFKLQHTTLKRKFEKTVKSLEIDKKNYIQAKFEAEKNIQMIEKEELSLQAFLQKAKLLCESKNEVHQSKILMENLRQIGIEMQARQKKLEIYPYFATNTSFQDTLTYMTSALQIEFFSNIYAILNKTGARITLEEQIKLSENYQVTWKGGMSQLVGAMLYAGNKIAENVVINDADCLILDESPASLSAKLTSEFKYQLNNPKPKKPKSKLFEPATRNYIQLKKNISGTKDGLPCDKEIDLTVGDKKTYQRQFVTGFAAGQLIIAPSKVIMKEKNYDIIHLEKHKLCIDKTDPYFEDFKFAFTNQVFLVARCNQTHKNHAYVVLKNYKKMCALFGEDKIILDASDRPAGDGKTTLISYNKYKSELYTVFSKQYCINRNACYQEVNSLVIHYGFNDKDVKPFLKALIQVKMEKDTTIIPKVAEIKDREKFIEEVIFHLCLNYPDISKIKDFDAKKLNKSCLSKAILHIAKHRNITSDTRDILLGDIATTMGLITPDTLTTETATNKSPSLS